METITLNIYSIDETPLLIKAEDIKFDYISKYKTKYFKITNPFIWNFHLIAGFYKDKDGIIGWANGELHLWNKTYPVSNEQLLELKKY
jgi:hypothetical protein